MVRPSLPNLITLQTENNSEKQSNKQTKQNEKTNTNNNSALHWIPTRALRKKENRVVYCVVCTHGPPATLAEAFDYFATIATCKPSDRANEA